MRGSCRFAARTLPAGALGIVHKRIENPRAYLLRIATNLWIDQVRRRTLERDVAARGDGSLPEPTPPAAPPDRGTDLRDAGAGGACATRPRRRARDTARRRPHYAIAS